MHDELTELAQHTAMRPPARASGTVADLARPVLSVGSSMPVGQLEVVFRNPDVTCVVVHDDAVPPPGAPAADAHGRLGVVVRSSLVAALTGRLGYGRAVLERRPVASVTDWAPLVVAPTAAVTEVATLAMSRPDDHRYDDVLVRGGRWASVGAAELVRSLVGTLAERSTHDALTGLLSRRSTWHSLTRRCRLVAHGGTRVALLLLDVQDMAGVNALHGQDAGDALLAGVGRRLRSWLPGGCEAGRVDGDRFAVLATLPAMGDVEAAASAEALRQEVLARLGATDGPARPTFRTSLTWSVAGAADADELVREGEARLAAARVPPTTPTPPRTTWVPISVG
ncbi:diguanylate cyclase (GGDEF)-like protein [Cellulosimicrobium cellulans]|uniref:GGDEF domain-containing protein n=1 Tax=Cellulosimicrobium cellulans TaxID=1710 RepID=UPI00195D98DB|nr:GGDEF domain-containing protein [Cellulosimicrobium cellulans]MBM7817542.1 diguanylate cyclase (GGDEF)-like protein [Cellulosimicrobium cellulans]